MGIRLGGETMTGKLLDVVAVGSWTNFDHLFRVDRLPMPGDTVQITGAIGAVEKMYWGGCAPNNAVAAAKLGASAALVSVVGRDFRERGYQSYLEALPVDLRGVVVLEDSLCGHSFLFSDPSGDAICLSHLGAAAFQAQQVPHAGVLASARVAVINYTFDDFTLGAAQIASEAGGQVVVSGALMTAPDYAAAMARAADILVCTEHELNLLMAHLGMSGQRALFDLGIQALVSTRGKQGSVLSTPEGERVIPAARPARFVDPVGAGDSFVGGLAAGLAFGLPLETALKLGAVVASYVIEAEGCQTSMPTREQASSRLREAFGLSW
jgi:sugar/nucleoside kinase (ribokinase family)